MKKKSYQARRKQLKTVIAWNVFSLFFMLLSFACDGKPFWNHPLPLIVTFFLWLNVYICARTLRRDFKHQDEPRNLHLNLPK